MTQLIYLEYALPAIFHLALLILAANIIALITFLLLAQKPRPYLRFILVWIIPDISLLLTISYFIAVGKFQLEYLRLLAGLGTILLLKLVFVQISGLLYKKKSRLRTMTLLSLIQTLALAGVLLILTMRDIPTLTKVAPIGLTSQVISHQGDLFFARFRPNDLRLSGALYRFEQDKQEWNKISTLWGQISELKLFNAGEKLLLFAKKYQPSLDGLAHKDAYDHTLYRLEGEDLHHVALPDTIEDIFEIKDIEDQLWLFAEGYSDYLHRKNIYRQNQNQFSIYKHNTWALPVRFQSKWLEFREATGRRFDLIPLDLERNPRAVWGDLLFLGEGPLLWNQQIFAKNYLKGELLKFDFKKGWIPFSLQLPEGESPGRLFSYKTKLYLISETGKVFVHDTKSVRLLTDSARGLIDVLLVDRFLLRRHHARASGYNPDGTSIDIYQDGQWQPFKIDGKIVADRYTGEKMLERSDLSTGQGETPWFDGQKWIIVPESDYSLVPWSHDGYCIKQDDHSLKCPQSTYPSDSDIAQLGFGPGYHIHDFGDRLFISIATSGGLFYEKDGGKFIDGQPIRGATHILKAGSQRYLVWSDGQVARYNKDRWKMISPQVGDPIFYEYTSWIDESPRFLTHDDRLFGYFVRSIAVYDGKETRLFAKLPPYDYYSRFQKSVFVATDQWLYILRGNKLYEISMGGNVRDLELPKDTVPTSITVHKDKLLMSFRKTPPHRWEQGQWIPLDQGL